MPSSKPFQPSPYGRLVGTNVLHSDPDARTIEIEYEAKPEFTNRIGTIAGGMIASLLDSVTGIVANETLDDGSFAVHTALAVQYHAPASPGRIVGRGEVTSVEGRDIESRGELFDGNGELLASAEARLRIIRAPRREGASTSDER